MHYYFVLINSKHLSQRVEILFFVFFYFKQHSKTNQNQLVMHKSYKIRNLSTNVFIGNSVLNIEEVSFESKEIALEFLSNVFEYGVNYEIVEAYYSFKTKD